MATDPHPSGAPDRPRRRRRWSPRTIAAGVSVTAAVAIAATAGVLSMFGGQTMLPAPSGTWGETEGTTRQLAPCLVAEQFSAPNRAGTGRATLVAPGGLRVTGSYRYTAPGDWTLHVDGARGTVGGLHVADTEANGRIAANSGAITATVDIPVGDWPGSPQWDHDGTITLVWDDPTDPQRCSELLATDREIPETVLAAASDGGLQGTAQLTATDGTSSVSLRGPINADGTATLAATGTLAFAGSEFAATGTYTSGPNPTSATWDITAPVTNHRLPDGSVIETGELNVTGDQPEVGGTVIVNPGPDQPTLAATVVDNTPTSWELAVTGSPHTTWSPDGTPDLTVATGAATGTVQAVPAGVSWSVNAGVSITYSGAVATGTWTISGPEQWSVEITDVGGSLTGISGNLVTVGASGTLTRNGSEINGSVTFAIGGNALIPLPGGWTTDTTVTVTFARANPDTLTGTSAELELVATASETGFGLSGSWLPDGYRLEATGGIGLGTTAVSVTGTYESTGWPANGSSRTEPYWDIVASLQGAALPGGGDFASGELTITSQRPGITGEASIRPVANEPFAIDTTIDYTNPDNWVFTVAPTGAEPWTPAGLAGLSIDPNALSGSVASTTSDGVVWDISIDEVRWPGIVPDTTLTSSFILTNRCPLDDNCPDGDNVFLGVTDGDLQFPSPVPPMTLNGAVTADGTWARFDAVAGSVSFAGVGIDDAALTMWKGPRTDSFNPDLAMPNLSGSNNGFGVEFCGNFTVDIPDIPTVRTGGCAAWTTDGVVLGQVALGGTFDTGVTNGIELGSTTIDGWAFSDLNVPTPPVVGLRGVRVPVPAGVNQITGTVTLPGVVMEALGRPAIDTPFDATGSFGGGDFSLEARVGVDLATQGVELEALRVEIAKQASTFRFGFGAEGRVRLNGQRFPLDAFVGVDTGPGGGGVVVRVSATGTRSAEPTGSFDDPTLVPSGDFEPAERSAVDGSNEGPMGASVLPDGDFEDAVAGPPEFPNPGFEQGLGLPLIADGDFESAETANIAINGDYEQDLNLVRNNDFDDPVNPLEDWYATSSSYPITSVPGRPDPNNVDNRALRVTSNTSSTSDTEGARVDFGKTSSQTRPVKKADYRVELWARSAAGNGQFNVNLRFYSTGDCSNGTTNRVASFTATSEWQRFTFTTTGRCAKNHGLIVTPMARNNAIEIDDIDVWVNESKDSSSVTVPQLDPPSTKDVKWNVYADTRKVRSGRGMFRTKATGGKARVTYDLLGEKPAANTAYTYGIWVKRDSDKNVDAELRIRAVGASGVSEVVRTVPFTATGSWQRVMVTIRVDSNDHPRLEGEIRILQKDRWFVVDDRTVQAMSWLPTNSATAAWVEPVPDPNPDPTEPGREAGEMHLRSQVSGTAGRVRYDIDATPVPGATYTYRARVRTLSGSIAGHIQLETLGSGTNQEARRNFTATTAWQWVELPFTPTVTGRTGLRARVQADPALQTLVVDDISVTGPTTRPQPADTAWTTSGGATAVVAEDPANARSGLGLLEVATTTAGGAVTRNSRSGSDNDVTGLVPQAGSTYTATAWVRSPTGASVPGRLTATVTGGGRESARVDFTATGQWTPVEVNLPVAATGATGMDLRIEVDAANARLWVDDTTTQLVGLSQPVPWDVTASGSTRMERTIIDDAAAAYSGTMAMQLTAFGGPGVASRTAEHTVTAGSRYTVSAWVRAGGSTPVTGSLRLVSPGSGATRSVPFTATDTWQQVFGTLTATGNDAALRTEVAVDTVGAPLLVDAVSVDPMQTWSVGGPPGVVVDHRVANGRDAQEGNGWLRARSSLAGGQLYLDQPVAPRQGSVHTARAWVRSAGDTPVTGTLVLAGEGGTRNESTQAFTTGDQWQEVEVTHTVTAANNSLLRVRIDVGTPGVEFDLDSVSLAENVVIPDDPWRITGPGAASSTAIVYRDPNRAHEGEGFFEFTAGASGSVVEQDVRVAPAAGDRYSLGVWVRSATTRPIEGRIELATVGGTATSAVAGFTATDQWQQVAVPLAITAGNHTAMVARVASLTPGIPLDIDSVVVQPTTWAPFAASGAVPGQVQRNDPDAAQSGSGYLEITTTSAAESGTRRTTPGAVPTGEQKLTAWVRSPGGDPVNGRVRLTATGPGRTPIVGTTAFEATERWRKIEVVVPVSQTGYDTLTSEVTMLAAAGTVLAVDTVSVERVELDPPDGIITPLPNPEIGYDYLWDNAFGIPGAHLWAITAQVEVRAGAPGLGVGATMYLDPTRGGPVFTGSTWMKGDLVANISATQPCFVFGFASDDPATGINLSGAFTTNTFELSIAPRGCTVGTVTVPVGSSLNFEASLGDAEVAFALAIGRDANNLPTFSFDTRLVDVTLAGTTYNNMLLSVRASVERTEVLFTGDFTMPFGSMLGDFELLAGPNDGFRMAGRAELRNWKLVSNDFKVNTLSYGVLLDIPAGSVCGNIETTTAGDLKMGSRSYQFSGELRLDCGVLRTLTFDLRYSKSNQLYNLRLAYSSVTNQLAGGLEFRTDRRTSWKVLGLRYRRTAKVTIFLDFVMNFNQPGSGQLTLGGKLSVSGGSGAVRCTLGSGGDDGCSVEFTMRILGKHTYRGSW